MAFRMVQQKVLLGGKYDLVLKRYEQLNKGLPDEEPSSEYHGEPKSKELAPVPLDGGSSALQNVALDF